MKVVYFDVETTGLDVQQVDLIEMSAAYMDYSKFDPLVVPDVPLQHRPLFHTLVQHSTYRGDAGAFAMNAAILAKLAQARTDLADQRLPTGERVVKVAYLLEAFRTWLTSVHPTGSAELFILAGKNCGNFDQQIFQHNTGAARDGGGFKTIQSTQLGYGIYHQFAARQLDPGPMWATIKDGRTPPNLKECQKRALKWLEGPLASFTVAGVPLDFSILREWRDYYTPSLSLDEEHKATEDVWRTIASVEVALLRNHLWSLY